MLGNRVAVLLCAGRSVRFGGEKPLLTICGESLVARALSAIKKHTYDQIIILVNDDNKDGVLNSVSSVTDAQFRLLVQIGDTVEGGIAQVIDGVPALEVLVLINVNDIVPKRCYSEVLESPGDLNIVVPTTRLEAPFIGGRIDLDANSNSVLRISERPLPYCKPGEMVNIFIHRITGSRWISRLHQGLVETESYEEAINGLLEQGASSKCVFISKWCAIKNPRDYVRAQEEFELLEP